jgi:hypothetical protein
MMRALNNLHLFAQTVVDSGALTPLGTIIHNFPEPGEYAGQVLRGKQPVATFQLTVDKKTQASQTDIDLALLDQTDLAGSVRGREFSQNDTRFMVSVSGYVVFHVSRGVGSYSVLVERRDQERKVPVFNSEALQEKDLFAVTLLRPGIYSVTNGVSGSKGEITVAYPSRENKSANPADLDPVRLVCGSDYIKPNAIKLQAGQGQVYQIKAPARLRIELVKPEDREEAGRPVARWQKPASGETKSDPSKR